MLPEERVFSEEKDPWVGPRRNPPGQSLRIRLHVARPPLLLSPCSKQAVLLLGASQ